MEERVTKPYGDIYFEKNLPKNCGGCPFQYDGISCEALDYGFCPEELGRCLDSKYGTAAYDDAIFDRRYSKCPLETTQSLKQQVRAEVVEDIKAELNKQKLVMKSDFHPREEEAIPWQDMVAILDQVKGETK